MTQKEKLIALLIILSAWTVFLFGDAFFATQQVRHASANNIESENISNNSKISQTVSKKIKNGLNTVKSKISETTKTIVTPAKKINLNNLELLENIYQKDDNPDVLKLLLQQLVEDYQFDKAKEYIGDINIFEDESVDAKTYIYTYINSLSITDDTSMQKFMGFIDQLRYKSMVSSDDYIFYQGLAKLWAKDYPGANILFAQIKSPIYQNFITQIDNSIDTFDNQQGVPSYYKDSLIALVSMKNGYFSLANKLAIGSVIDNSEYILPHQVLAYSNFLTNNREKSIENFYDLVELDPENQDKYNFYIGSAHYRWGDYQESISILSQLLDSPKYKTDAYRYLLLNYEKLEDEQKMIQVWQKILGQNDLQESDFKYFYDLVFYKPFSTDSKYTIYSKHKQLSYDFVSICYEEFGQQNDTCLYGEVGLDVTNSSRQDVKNGLLYLAENYPQAHIFQALGDYYTSQNLEQKAKTYYLQAVSLTDNISQKDVIESKLISEI